jgi:hypothetical protein
LVPSRHSVSFQAKTWVFLFFKTRRTADGSADRHAWSSGTMGENAGA